jgi:hypothetical protein
VREPTSPLVGAENGNCPFMAGDGGIATHDRGSRSGTTGSRCWHRRHLNKSFLDGA